MCRDREHEDESIVTLGEFFPKYIIHRFDSKKVGILFTKLSNASIQSRTDYDHYS